MRWLFLIALAVLGAPTVCAKEGAKPAVVAPPAQPRTAALPLITPTEESQALALELAALLNSEELTRRQLKKAYTETLPKLFAENAQFRALEFQYPGVTAVAIKAEEEIVVPGTIALLPGIHAALAKVISARITAQELNALLTFYRSPVGMKVINGIAEGTDFSAIAQKNIENENIVLTEQDIKSATSSAAMPGILQSFTKEDMQNVARWSVSVPARKWQKMEQVLLSTIVEFRAQSGDGLKTKAQENVAVAVMQYMRDHPSKMSTKK